MTTLTQKIPNLLRGISQQPDVKKFPGEVRDCVNAFPEYALGLMKRPGAKLEAPLRGAATPSGTADYPGSLTRHYGATEKWFDINVAGTSYVGQINDFSYSDGGSKDHLSLQLWFKNSGVPRAVNLDDYMQADYISSGSWSTYQTNIDNEVTALSNKITGLATFQTEQKDYYTEYLKTIDQFASLFSIETDYQQGQVNQFITTAVLVNAAGTASYIKDGVTMTGTESGGEFTETSSSDVYKKGTKKTSEYPILMDTFPADYELYELISVTKATDANGTALDTYETDTYDPAQTTYNDLVTTYNTEVTDTDDSYPELDSTILPINGASNYFVDDVAGGGAKVDLSKLKVFTFQDTTFILNPNKKVEYTSDTTDIARFNEGFIFFKVLSDGVFEVTITKLRSDSNGNQPNDDNYTRTLDTAFDTDGVITGSANYNASNNTVEELRGLLVTSFEADYGASDWGNHFTFTQSGNGIYIATKDGIATFTHNGVADASRTAGTYIVTGVAGSSNGDYGEFRVVVAADGTPTITLLNGGMGFAASETLTITDASLGGGGGANITVTVSTVSAEDELNGQFELTVSGPTDDSISTLRHEVNNVSDLPLQLKNGYKVKVVNSLDVNADDMYLVFETEEQGNNFSGGTWVEGNGRGIKYIIDKNTMPHALTVNSDGSFSFGPWDSWENRLVGDEITNPTPHFITLTGGASRFIKDMFVYRNRLGFLTEDYVSLSRAGEFFNFFVKSAVASGDDDPIDISVSDSDSPSLNYVSKETAGLLLYGKTGQYLLATDSDILSPTTAKINKVAGFEADINNPAISLGSTTAFISKTQSTTKMFELLKVNALEPPQSVEQTRTVPELVPTTVNSIVGSPDVGIVSFGTIGQTTLYHFSYLRMGGQELSRSWYKWELPGTLLHQFFDGNEFHCILKTNQDQIAVVSFDVAQSSTDGVLTLESGKRTDLVLDLYDDKPFFIYRGIVSGTFEDRTRIFLPLDKLDDKKLVIVMYSNRSQVFDEDTVTLTEGTDATHGKYVEVDGDWRGSDVFIGYKYNMSVELPRIYYKEARDQQVNADVEAELIIHKLKVKTGLTGPIDYKINIIGIPVRTSTLTVTPVGQYNLNSVNMTESAVHHVPVYQRNHNTTITIESNTAFPATVESINWEGRYATNYYRRA